MTEEVVGIVKPLPTSLCSVTLPKGEGLLEATKNCRCGDRSGNFVYFFSSLEYPLPYCTHRDTRLKVAEEMSACAMTWL